MTTLPTPALGQTDTGDTGQPSASGRTGVTLWLFRSGNVSAEDRKNFRRGLREALDGVGTRHLLDREDFENHLRKHSAPVPDCIKGLERCVSPKATAFEAAGLETVVRLRLQPTDGALSARYELLDARGRVAQQSTLRAQSPRELAFSVVGEIFDATGSISLRTTPPGARVTIDGEAVGTTPLDTRLPVGTHSYTVELEEHQTIEDAFEVTSSKTRVIRHKLAPEAGELVVEGAPDSATVHIDGESVGTAGEPIELPPGSHEMTVRADGYEPFEMTIQIEPGQTARHSAPLEREGALLGSVDSEKIANNRYIFRLTYDQSIHGTTFRDARGELGGREFEFLGFVNSNDTLNDDLLKRTVAPPGVRLDFSYTTRYLGVVLMSLSYSSVGLDQRAIIDQSPTESGDERLVNVIGMRRLQLRPFQITGRYIYKNFVPQIELGTGIAFQWIEVEPEMGGPSFTLRQTEPYWTLGFNGQYFFTPHVFGMLRYSFQDYFNAGRGVEHVISLGAGAALPNIFGLEPEPPEEL